MPGLPCVLFVDDEPAILSGITRALRREPYEILTATSADEARSILGLRSVDVVISDERMPGCTGAEFLNYVRRHFQKAIRIMLTGEVSLGTNVRAIEDGGLYRFLSKPIGPDELSRTIKQALQMKELTEKSERMRAPPSRTG